MCEITLACVTCLLYACDVKYFVGGTACSVHEGEGWDIDSRMRDMTPNYVHSLQNVCRGYFMPVTLTCFLICLLVYDLSDCRDMTPKGVT